MTLLETIAEHGFDACIGGARRDEEKARAKERIFSFRDEFGQWDPKAQRPELWDLYNTRVHPGENMRVFPISNWTELDVWQYIAREKLALPPIYFAHERQVIPRNGLLVPLTAADPAARRRDRRNADGALPHRRRHLLHLPGGVRCGDRRRHHRRDRDHPDHRARRDPHGRPDLGSVDGKTQESKDISDERRH